MKKFKLTHTVLLFILVTGCANVEQSAYTAAELQQANMQQSQRVNDAANQVETDYLKAIDKSFNYYVPNTWKSIQKDLISMRQLVKKFDPSDQGFFGGPSEQKVLTSISDVSNQLLQAKETKIKVITFLAKPLADIEYLKPKVDTTWQRDFNSINQNMNTLINNIEKNYAQSRQQSARDKLQGKINELEINIVTADYYSPLEKKLEQLNKQLIPLSYNHVLQDLQQLNHVITTTPRDTRLLTAVANLVKKDIQSAQHVTTDVVWINKLNKKQREEIVLHYRATLESLGLNFIDQDLSNLSYKAQVQTFEFALSAKLADFETKDVEIILTESVESKIESHPIENVTVENTAVNSIFVTDTTKNSIPLNTTENMSVDASPEDVPIETTQVTTNQ